MLLHLGGKCLLTQDKQRGFTITTQQSIYKTGFSSPRDEYIAQGQHTSVLEARHGRFAVHICEDLSRTDMQEEIIKSGTTHLMVPVLAGAMWERCWQVPNAVRLAEEAGTDVTVSNGLAIERNYRGNPVPTLLVFSVPPGREDYISVAELLTPVCLGNVPSDAREDALTARLTDW